MSDSHLILNRLLYSTLIEIQQGHSIRESQPKISQIPAHSWFSITRPPRTIYLWRVWQDSSTYRSIDIEFERPHNWHIQVSCCYFPEALRTVDKSSSEDGTPNKCQSAICSCLKFIVRSVSQREKYSETAGWRRWVGSCTEISSAVLMNRRNMLIAT